MSSENNQNPNQIAGALTYPGRSDQNAQRVPIQPRPPRDLQGLLRFALEATKAEDAPGNSNVGPLHEERRRFLESALKSMTVDIGALIQDAIKVLSDVGKMSSIQMGEPLPDDVVAAFNNLSDYVESIDVANDFYKLGGFAIFPTCFGSDNEEVRAQAYNVLAEICQNNPYCQTRALETGLVNVLLNLVGSEKGMALSKCIYALSCSCRGSEGACRELVSQGTCADLVRILATQEDNVRVKVAFFISYLCNNVPEAKAQFIEHNLVQIITDQIKDGRDRHITENILSILVPLLEDQDPTVLAQCRDPSIGLQQSIVNYMKNPELTLEEKSYCEEVLKRAFQDGSQQTKQVEDADR